MPRVLEGEVAALVGPAMPRRPRVPLWGGPEAGGVTQSLLSRFLNCRERFRLLAVDGLRAREGFSHRLEFGNLWHAAEEGYAAGADPTNRKHPLWERKVDEYAAALARRYPFDRDKVDHWYQLCRRQFPLYLDYWAGHPDEADRTNLLHERVFAVPYRLPSGRAVTLRGKWDGVDLIRAAGRSSVWLMEHKTKGDVYEPRMARQLSFDLQTLIYLVALDREWNSSAEWYGCDTRKVKVAGVRYNVVRRPLSGGKYTVTRHKAGKGSKCGRCKGTGEHKGGQCLKCLGRGRLPGKPEETAEHFYDRVAGHIKADPGHFFMRWNVQVTPAEVAKFRRETLDPLLESLWDWWEWVCPGGKPVKDPFAPRVDANGLARPNTIHWRHPFGVRNVLDEGGATELDAYLATGDMTGLSYCDDLFPELKEST